MKRKTTLFIDDMLFKQAKRIALDQDMTLQEVTNQALQTYIELIHQGFSTARTSSWADLKKMFRGIQFTDQDIEEAKHALWRDQG